MNLEPVRNVLYYEKNATYLYIGAGIDTVYYMYCIYYSVIGMNHYEQLIVEL